MKNKNIKRKLTPTWMFLAQGILGFTSFFLIALTESGFWGTILALPPLLLGWLGMGAFTSRLRERIKRQKVK